MKESIIFREQNLTEKVHYVYRVTIDGQYYIGKRTGFLNDLETGVYKTSSKLVHEKLKNGIYFSKIKIIQVFYTSEEALEYEKKFLTRVNARTNPKFLNQSNGGDGDFTCKQHTEKSKKKMSEITKERFDINTEQGRKNRENLSKKNKEITKAQFDVSTEQGIRRRENQSKMRKEYFNPNTKQGRRNREKRSQISKSIFDINTEQGRKRRDNQSNKMKDYYNTEEGKERRERAKVVNQKSAETRIQNRKNASVLGELMFDKKFLRQNFLITDDKNNLRFLWSVYSKLSGYCECSVRKQKQNGKISFLSGIRSIKLSVKEENSKIEEIKAIIKSRNEKRIANT